MAHPQPNSCRSREPSTRSAAESPSTPARRWPQLPSSTPAVESAPDRSWPDAASYNQSLPALHSATPSTVQHHPPQRLQVPPDPRLHQPSRPNEPTRTDTPPPPGQGSSTDADPRHTAPSGSSK